MQKLQARNEVKARASSDDDVSTSNNDVIEELEGDTEFMGEFESMMAMQREKQDGRGKGRARKTRSHLGVGNES